MNDRSSSETPPARKPSRPSETPPVKEPSKSSEAQTRSETPVVRKPSRPSETPPVKEPSKTSEAQTRSETPAARKPSRPSETPPVKEPSKSSEAQTRSQASPAGKSSVSQEDHTVTTPQKNNPSRVSVLASSNIFMILVFFSALIGVGVVLLNSPGEVGLPTSGSLFLYMLALIAFTADVITIFAFLDNLQSKDYKAIPVQVIALLSAFIACLSLVYFASTADTALIHLAILKFFSWVYLTLTFVHILLSSYLLKGHAYAAKDYIAYSVSSLIVFTLAAILLEITNSSVTFFAYMFFLCVVVQIFFFTGEYVLKRSIKNRAIPVGQNFGSEFPTFFQLVKDDWVAVKRSLLAGEGNFTNEIQYEPEPVNYKNLALDLGFMIYTSALALALLSF